MTDRCLTDGIPHSYYPLIWFFLIGIFLPIPFYYLACRYPRSFWRYINIPVALVAADSVPPANGINFMLWILVGFTFQWFMRRFHYRWWVRYNYLLSTGLDAGAIIGLIIIFFALQLPKGSVEFLTRLTTSRMLNGRINCVFLNNQKPILAQQGVRRVSVVLSCRGQYPWYFTLHERNVVWQEEQAIRNIEPALAYQLELSLPLMTPPSSLPPRSPPTLTHAAPPLWKKPA